MKHKGINPAVRGKFSSQWKHGMCGTPTYNTWVSMLNRCLRPRCKDYARWGAQGIRVCDRWLEFSNFFADMGQKPVGMTLDRINGAKVYGPGNCKWSTPKEQSANRKNTAFVSTPTGVITLVDFAASLGVPRTTVRRRLDRGAHPGCLLIRGRAA